MVSKTDYPQSQGYHSPRGEPTVIKYWIPCPEYYEHHTNTPTKTIREPRLCKQHMNITAKSIWAGIWRWIQDRGNIYPSILLYAGLAATTTVTSWWWWIRLGGSGEDQSPSLWNLQKNDLVICRLLWAVPFQKDRAPSLCFQVTRLAWEWFVPEREDDKISSEQLSWST